MEKSIKISIPTPCSENWNAMLPNDAGRFCATCQKTVIDFTAYSNDALIAYFQKTTSTPCGRFNQEQLTAEIQKRSKTFSPLWKIKNLVAASLLLIASLPKKTFAQKVTTVQLPTSTNEKKQEPATIDSTQKLITIKGIVVDENNEVIPGASIKIHNTNIGTTTDVDGKFELVTVTKKGNKYLDISVSAIGFGEKNIIISTEQQQPMKINMEQGINGMIVINKPTKWQRFKTAIKNFFF